METSEERRARVDPEINRPLNSLDVTPLRKSRTPLETFKKVGIPIIAAVLSLATIVVVAILIKVILDYYFFICGQPLLFIPREQVCDGHQDCALGEDEQYCVKKLPDGPPVAVRLSRDRSTLQVLNPTTKNWASACFDSFTEALAKTACRQMGYDSKPTFRAVDVGSAQDLDIVKITENLQELQVQNSSGPCLSGSLVSLQCLGQHPVQQTTHLWREHPRPALDPHGRPLLLEASRCAQLEGEGWLRQTGQLPIPACGQDLHP